MGLEKGRGNINVVLDQVEDEGRNSASLFRTLNRGCVFHFQSFNEELFNFLLDTIPRWTPI